MKEDSAGTRLLGTLVNEVDAANGVTGAVRCVVWVAPATREPVPTTSKAKMHETMPFALKLATASLRILISHTAIQGSKRS